jgi:hypothetical protein
MNRLQTYQCTIILLLILLVPPVFAGDHTNDDFTGLTAYEYYYGTVSLNADTMVAGKNSTYQSFTIGTVSSNETFTVKGITIAPFGYGETNAFTMEIFNATNQSNCLFTERVSIGHTGNMEMGGSFPGGIQLRNITLEQNGTLYKGTTYCYRFRADTVNSQWIVTRSDGYSGGMAHSNDEGNTWVITTDNWFGIYGEVPALSGLSIVNSQPLNNSNLTDFTINFGCNATRFPATSITNITSVVLNITNGSLNWLQTIGSLNASNYNATFLNSTMRIGLYNWSCTAYGDTANATSGLYYLNRTDIIPSISIIYPVYNQTYFNVSHFNYTFFEDNPGTCVFWNGSLNLTITCGDNVTGLTPPEGQNEWRIFINNTMGMHSFDTVNFTIHTGTPLIDYNGGTATDGSNLSQNYFNINVTIFEQLPNNITYRLFLSNGTVLTNLSGSTSYNHNFTNLPNDLYYYNVTICDLVNNCNYTRTQSVMIDYQKPVVNIITPTTGTQTPNHNVNFTWTVSDVNNRSSINNNTLCYQEFANVSTGCGGLSTGSYSDNGNWKASNPVKNTYDGDWDSYGISLVSTGSSSLEVNYTKPNGAKREGTLWEVKDSAGVENLTIPSHCWNFNLTILSLKYVSPATNNPETWLCRNDTGFFLLRQNSPLTNRKIYEEGIYWNFTSYTSSGIINTTLRVYNQSGSLVNITTTSIFGNIFNFIINLPMNLINGIYTFFASAIDYATNIGVSNNATVTIDDQSPMLNISYPTNTTYTTVLTTSPNTSSHIDWQISDMINFSNCWYQIDNGTKVFVQCHLNTTSFPLNFSNYNITFFVNDTLNNTNFTTVFATWRYMIRTNSVSFNDLSTELTSQPFVYNSTIGPTVTGITTLLNYNNTEYTSNILSDGINTLFTNDVITPLVLQETNITFFWNITVGDSINTFSVKSSLYNQTITPISIGVCNEIINQTIYNFTAYDEDTLFRIKPFYFGGDFSFSINGSIKKTLTVTNVSDEIDVCIYPASSIINLDVYATYDEDKNITQTYTARNFVLQNHIKSNNTELVNLTLLNISRSTTFTLKVQDSDLVPLSNYVINTYRLNPSTGQYYLTQAGKTDGNGLTSGFFVVNTVDYKFNITHDDVVVLETDKQKVIPQTLPYTLVFTISPSQTNVFENLLNITNLNFTFSNLSNGVQFSYSDSSGNLTLGRLVVYRINHSGQNILICNVTSALSTSALSCNFAGVNGTYSATGYITRNGIEFFVDAIGLIFPSGGMGWGLYGVFLGFIMILVSSFAFRYNEIAGIWLVVVTIIIVNIIGLINFGLPFISAMVVIGIILSVVFKQ